MTFSVPIKKEIRKRDKDGNNKIIKISYKIKFIDSFRFMAISLSNLLSNLCAGLRSDKCADCKSCLDYMIVKDEQLIFRCFECKKNYKKDFDKELINRFSSTYEFCNGDISKFILLLRKGFILMNTWIIGKDLMRHYCLIKKLFTVT